MDDTELPQRLAHVHRAHGVGDLVVLDEVVADLADSPHLELIVEGAGFEKARAHKGQRRVRRLHTLADRVGPDMRLLIVGLNPSPASADSGIGFHRPGNRFWPAAIAAGLASVDRDPDHALEHHGMGMTDIVKRTTRRADELSSQEFRDGMIRVERLVEWLEPQALCFVGLQGWRAAVDKKAGRGWQDRRVGDRPVYLMPSTSGLNAHDTVDSLTVHFATAVGKAPG